VEVGQDGAEVGGAEARRDGGECRGRRALPDGIEEMAAVAEQDADGVEEGCDVLGHGRVFAGLILWRIGRRGGMGRVEFNGGISNVIRQRGQRLCVDGNERVGLRPVATNYMLAPAGPLP
jgi:hypothetical protein